MNVFTGHWRITCKLHGSSYEMEHMQTHTVTKWHAAHLSPFPLELLPFKPADGADNRYGQIYTPIRVDPYSDTKINGFTPNQHFKESQLSPALSGLTSLENIISPSLADLNTEFFD